MEKEIKWQIQAFRELSIESLYNILSLRNEVFIVEQNCVYMDTDAKDQKALHLQGYINDQLVAYCRLFQAGDYFEEASIGRVVVSPKFRMLKLGHQLMDNAIQAIVDFFGEYQITISAQLYLRKFYEAHDFVKISDIYQEDGIPHIRMQRNHNELKTKTS